MPILRYFAVVAPLLLGMLYLAEAKLPPPPERLNNSTTFHGLPQPPPARADATTMAVIWAPEPDMSSPLVRAAASHEPVTTASIAPATKLALAAKSEPKKKTKKVVRRQDWRNNFAQAHPSQWQNSQTRVW